MPKRKAKPHGGGKRGGDDLTDRERSFVRERRSDTVAPMHEIMRRAGFLGTPSSLARRALALMHQPKISAAVYAPDPSTERDVKDELGLKIELRRFFLSVVRSTASISDKIKAADKLGAALAGFYVPVQIDMKTKLTLENLLTGAGLAPGQVIELPTPHKEDA